MFQTVVIMTAMNIDVSGCSTLVFQSVVIMTAMYIGVSGCSDSDCVHWCFRL